MVRPPRIAQCHSRRAARLRVKYRVELLARHGLATLPTSAEIFLAAAGDAQVAGDPGKVARALDSADRSAGAAARAARGRPARVPPGLRPAPPPPRPAAPAAPEPAPDPVQARIADLERQLAAPAGRGWKVGGAP